MIVVAGRSYIAARGKRVTANPQGPLVNMDD